ncbi:hypothetical protein BC936DRAFT_146267, partial [Jimgerdemannia flammicorona]
MIPFLVVLAVELLAFTQAFYVFVRHASPQMDPNSLITGTVGNTMFNGTISPYDPTGKNFSQDFLTELYNTFSFTSQNFQTIELFEPNCFLAIITVTFALVINVLLMNVLIALLNNVYTEALKSGQRLWLLLFVEIVTDIELSWCLGVR